MLANSWTLVATKVQCCAMEMNWNIHPYETLGYIINNGSVLFAKMTYPMRIFYEVTATGSLIDPLRVDSLLNSTLCFPNYLPEFWIFGEIISMRIAWRTSSVSIQKWLPFTAPSRTPSRNAHDWAWCSSKSAPGTRRLGGTVAKISWVP